MSYAGVERVYEHGPMDCVTMDAHRTEVARSRREGRRALAYELQQESAALALDDNIDWKTAFERLEQTIKKAAIGR